MNRRHVLGIVAAGAVGLVLGHRLLTGREAGSDGRGAAAELPSPTGGNAEGDVTLVAWLDYNCPICKQTAEDLRRFVEEDGGIRLVYRDWPVLGGTSIHGAKLALAAMYQGRYETAHRALMGLRGGRISEQRMDAAIEASGIDMERLRRDLEDHEAEISRMLSRNTVEAASLGLAGTPAYLIDRVRAHSLDRAGFRQVVDEVRRMRRSTPEPAKPAGPAGATTGRLGDRPTPPLRNASFAKPD